MSLRGWTRLVYGASCAAPIVAGALHIVSILGKHNDGVLAEMSAHSLTTLMVVGAGLMLAGALAFVGLPGLKSGAVGPLPIVGCVFLIAVVLGIMLSFWEYRGLPLAAFPLLALVFVLKLRGAGEGV